jgi:hypothetical protein
VSGLRLDVAIAAVALLALGAAIAVGRFRSRPCGGCGRPESLRKSCWCQSSLKPTRKEGR